MNVDDFEAIGSLVTEMNNEDLEVIESNVRMSFLSVCHTLSN